MPAVTGRDLPPRDEPALRRWFDRTRWKFGKADWFAAAEQRLRVGDPTDAHRIVLNGVTTAIRVASTPTGPVAASVLLSQLEPRLANAQWKAEATANRHIVNPAPQDGSSPPCAPKAAAPAAGFPPAAEPKVERRRPAFLDLLLCLLRLGFTTSTGLLSVALISIAGAVAYRSGHADWILIAAFDCFAALVFVRYPGIAALSVIGLPINAVVNLAEDTPVPLSTFAHLAAICVLALILALGVRMLVAVLWQTLRVAVALVKLLIVIGLVFGAISVVAAPIALPLAAVSLASLFWAFWVTLVIVHVYKEAVIPAVDARAERFFNSVHLPPFHWESTPFGRLELLAAQHLT